MAEVLDLALFGGLRIRRGGAPLTGFHSRKVSALLAYLAVTGRPQPREVLASLLWGELPEASARANLRQALTNLRALVGEHLLVDRTSAAVDSTGACQVDVIEFETHLRLLTAGAPPDPAALAAAVALYTGDLLAGVALPDAPAFDEWLAGQRERLRHLALRALHALTGAQLANGDAPAAIATLRRFLELEPWHEETHRWLMEVLAAGGWRSEALAQYAACRRLLAAELGVEPAPETTALYERIRAGRVGAEGWGLRTRGQGSGVRDQGPEAGDQKTGSSRQPPAPRHNLPTALTSFVGRAAAVAEVGARLSETRLLTLTGPAGVGKTRLAVAVAADRVDAYPDGVWLVELAALADPGLVAGAVAGVLGVHEQPDQPLSTTLQGALRDRLLLLVLDNCEHLLDACARLADGLLRGCPGLQILATSREALTIAGETTWRVPSLAVVPPAASVAEVGASAAGQLFIERARAARPDFQLTEHNATAVAEVCRRLDGIPLALELAAARVPALGVAGLATRLDQCFRLLTNGSRAALPRQQTLAAAVGWSYDLLTNQEQALFNRLSVFAGGWTLAAAEAVCDGDGIADGAAVDLLTRLVEKSLVVAEETAGGEARYRLLETLRQYGREQLLANGALASVHERHAAHYLALAEAAEPCLRGPDQLAWLARLEAEHDNLRAALGWWADRGDAEQGLQLAGALHWFWHLRDHVAEGRRWLERLLALPGAGATTARARALYGLGLWAWLHADYQSAHALFAEALAIAEATGSWRWRAYGLQGLAIVAYGQAAYDEASAQAEAALDLCRAGGDHRESALLCSLLGLIAAAQGDREYARSRLDEGLLGARFSGDRWLIAVALEWQADLAWREGDYTAAQAGFEGAAATYRAVGHRKSVADALHALGDVALLAGELATARAHFEAEIDLRRAVGDLRHLARAIHGLARVAGADGETGEARQRYRESLALWQELGQRDGLAEVLEGCASLAVRQGRAARGLQLAGTAAALRVAIGTPPTWFDQLRTAWLERTLAEARQMLGPAASAAAWASGQAMTVEHAIACALEGEGDGKWSTVRGAAARLD
jgi:non-specific serine/threonine protein kinase